MPIVRIWSGPAGPCTKRACALSGSPIRKLWVSLLVGAACSEQPVEPASHADGGSPPAASSAGGTTLSGGASVMAGSGGAISVATSGSGGQSSGALGGAAGAQSTAGAQSGAGGNAAASSGGGGAGGSANDPAADLAAFAALDGFQLLDPCDLTSYTVQADPGAVCPQKNDVKNQHVTLHLAGDASVTYAVKLRVRGIVERYWYDGGSLDPVSKVFYTGGVPTVGGNASACKNQASSLPFTLPAELSPVDGCFNGFNVFAMNVSAPKTHFFLNYTADKDGDRPPHAVYTQDYTVSIDLQGQATLDFFIIGSDEHECYNHNQVIDGVELSSSPYVGEFLQFDVLGVTRK
jgi:hypothetical protein